MREDTQRGTGIDVAPTGWDMENNLDALENIDPLRLLTLKETAAVLQISERTALRMIDRKKLPAFKVGGQWRVSENKLTKLLESLSEL